MGVCCSADKNKNLKYSMRQKTDELARMKPKVVGVEEDRLIPKKLSESGVIRFQSPNRSYNDEGDKEMERYIKRLQILDPVNFGDESLKGVTFSTGGNSEDSKLFLFDMYSKFSYLCDRKSGKVIGKVSSKYSNVYGYFEYNDKLISIHQEKGEGKIKINNSQDTNEKTLEETYKLKYRGRKASNSLWNNYGRCCSVDGSILTFVSSDQAIVMYDLERNKLHRKLEVEGAVQDFDKHNSIIFILCEDKCIRHNVMKNLSIEVPIKGMEEGIFTCVACVEADIVVCSYMHELECNTFLLIDTSDNSVSDKLIVKSLEKSNDHHVHSMKTLTRSGAVHLISISICSTLNLLVVYRNRLHPIKCSMKVHEQYTNGMIIVDDSNVLVFGMNAFIKIMTIF